MSPPTWPPANGGNQMVQKQSTSNTTTTALGSSATWVGHPDIGAGMPDVLLDIESDQAGTVFCDFSPDGTNWDRFPPAGYPLQAGIHFFHKLLKAGKYFRLTITNGSVAQTYLRAYTYFGTFGFPTAPVGFAIDDNADAQTVKAILTAKGPDGTYRNATSNIAGALSVANFNQQVGRGTQTGFTAGSMSGRNPDLDASTAGLPEDIWGGGDEYTGQPTSSGDTITITGAAADTSTGTGMRTIKVYGLFSTASEAEDTVTYTMAGASGVTSTESWYRAYRAVGASYGSGGTNAGQVTIFHTGTTANIFARIPAGDGETQICAFTVPAGCTGQVLTFDAEMSRANGSAGSVDVQLMVREFGSGGYNAVRDYSVTHAASIEKKYQFGLGPYPELTDFKVRCDKVSDNNTTITAEAELLISAATT